MATKAQRYAAARKRGIREQQRLEALFQSLDASEQTGSRGQRIREQQAWIREASEGSKLRGKRTPAERLKATLAANRLEALIPKKGSRESKASRQEREDRMFRSQVRHEEEYGMPTSTFGGEAGTGHYERIFYIATESFWSGEDPKDRDKAIIKALKDVMEERGLDLSLENAYKIVLEANEEAVEKMRELSGGGFTKWTRGDSPDEIMAYIVNAATLIKDRTN